MSQLKFMGIIVFITNTKRNMNLTFEKMKQ